MKVNFFTSKREYNEKRAEFDSAIAAALENGIATLGKEVTELEKSIQEFTGAKHAIGVASGTDALVIASDILGFKNEKEVITSPFTFLASTSCIARHGGKPVFVDIDAETFDIDINKIEEKVTDKTAGIIPIHLFSQMVNMDGIMDIAKKHDLRVLEDAAEALGATYKGKYSGTIGYLGIFSFNGNKIITTSGGGMLVSEDEDAIKKVRFWATQSRDSARHYEHSELGYNYRMSNILAGIGRGQLRVLGKRIEQKKHIFQMYKTGLEDISDIEFMPIASYGQPNYWLSVITLREGSAVRPLDIIIALEDCNVETRPVWKPMHLQPVFKACTFFPHNENGKAVSEDIFTRGICLPSDTKMSDEDINRIIFIIKKLWTR
jgi:pyridoxal phosphate-dependent aminotransferase EpsN